MTRSSGKKPTAPPAARRKRPAHRARLEVDARRAQLLDLGLAIFSDRAYDDVSIDDLARAAGVSKGLLYHYFPTKRDLYVECLRHASKQLLAETLTDPDLPPEERARRGLDTYLTFVERHGKAYAALVSGGVGSDPEVASVLEETRATFAERLVAEMPGEVDRPLMRMAMRGWIGFVEATALDFASHRRVSRDELLDLLSSVLFDVTLRASGVSVLPIVGAGRPRR